MNYKVIPLTRDEENQLRYQHVPTVSAIEITATTPQSASVAAQPYEGPSIAYPRNPGFLQGFSHPNGSHPQAFPVEAQPIILANRANPGYNQYQEPPNGLSYSKLQFMGLTRATQWCLGFIACCCCSCCIITSIVATALAYGINQNKGYLMTGYYTNSDCSGEAVYELGTRTDNCFALGSKNSLQFIPSSQNTSIFTYQDRVCNKQIPNTTPQTISYETCEEVDDVPGLYRKSFYSKNDYVYLFYGPYVPNDGYIDSDCSSSIEKMYISMYNCIPTSSNSAIKITADSKSVYLIQYPCNTCNCSNDFPISLQQGCYDTYYSYIPTLNEPYSLARYRLLRIGSTTQDDFSHVRRYYWERELL